MVTLTEDMVIARSKGSDLHNIRKLNCWGSELADVSVVRKLPNVEVLSLSVNRIATLADFQACHNLQELYIRKNNIADINEVLYLRELPKLRSLWLADNPCAEFEQYRYTVLRALPHLQKLDNVPIEPEEVQRAMVCGMALPFSNSPSKLRSNEDAELPRSNSAGDSLRSSGGGSSISDSTPSSPERRYSHSTSPLRLSHQDMSEYSRSSNDGYVYEDERPVSQQQQRRNSSSQQSRQQLQQQHSQQQQDSDYGDRRISQTSAYSNSQSPSRRVSRVSQVEQQQQQQQQHHHHNNYEGDYTSRSYNNRDYEYDSRNANYLDDVQSRYPPSVGSHPLSTTSPSSTSNISSPSNMASPITTSPTNNKATTNNTLVTADTNENNNCPLHRRSSQASSSREQYREQPHHRYSVEDRSYSESNGYSQVPSSEVRHSPVGNDYRSPTNHESDMVGLVQQHYNGTYRRVEQQMEAASHYAAVERPSPTKPYPVRPKTRNANVLSAILCLIKELDYSSLEVVEMAVRCRMAEVEE